MGIVCGRRSFATSFLRICLRFRRVVYSVLVIGWCLFVVVGCFVCVLCRPVFVSVVYRVYASPKSRISFSCFVGVFCGLFSGVYWL